MKGNLVIVPFSRQRYWSIAYHLTRRGLVLSSGILPGLVSQILVDLGHHFWSELREQLKAFDVVDDLLRSRGARDDRGHVFILQTPCQCQLRQLDSQFIRQLLCHVSEVLEDEEGYLPSDRRSS